MISASYDAFCLLISLEKFLFASDRLRRVFSISFLQVAIRSLVSFFSLKLNNPREDNFDSKLERVPSAAATVAFSYFQYSNRLFLDKYLPGKYGFASEVTFTSKCDGRFPEFLRIRPSFALPVML